MSDSKEDKRAKARAAMEGERHKAARKLEEQDVVARREEARRAMEGPKHKAEREAKEKAIKEAEESKLKLIEDLDKERQEAREAEAKKREQERLAEEQAWREKKAREDKVKESKATIERLAKEDKVSISPIHTFQSDLAEAAKSDSISVEKIIIKEKERARAEAVPPRENFLTKMSGRAWAITAGVIVVIVLIGGGAYLVWPSNINQPAIPPLSVPSIITPSERREINTTGLSPERLLGVLSRQAELIATPEEAVTQFYFIDGDGAARHVLNFNELIDKLVLDLPLTFTQNITNNFMAGIYHGQEPALFFLFPTDSPDALRSAMLGDEKRIISELFRPVIGRDSLAMAETSRVRDAILSNVDVRIFADSRGRTVFVYGLVANNLLIVTQNETTFNKLFHAYRP